MTSRAFPFSRHRAVWSMALSATALGAMAPSPADALVVRSTVAGPSANLDIAGNGQVDVDVAPDGSAALAFRQKVGGVDHAFVSRYVNRNWTVPVRVDLGLATPSGKPAVAVASGGRTVVVFPNGSAGNERLYAAIAPDTFSQFNTKVDLQLDPAGWKDVDLDLAPNGDGYFTVYQGFNLRAWRVQGSTFTQVGANFPGLEGVLNAAPGEQAESGDQRGAHVAVDATGATATIAWTETSGLAYKPWARKLSGTAPAQVGAAVDATVATLDGKAGEPTFNDMASVSVGGDGKAWVAFRAGFDYSGTTIGRAVVRGFDGTSFTAPQVIDGLPAAPTESAEYPRIATNASGAGLAASYRQLTFGTEAASLGAGGSWSTGQLASTGTNLTAGRASVALGDGGIGLISMYTETVAGQGRIVGRLSGGPDAATLQPLSDQAFGPAVGATETAAGGEYAVTAFLQGSGLTTRIVAALVPLPAAPSAPAPGTPGTTGNQPPAGAQAAPSVTKLRLRRKTLTPSTLAPKLVSSTSRKRTLSFTVDRPATVKLTVKRIRPGKRAAGTCVSAKGKPVARRKRCDFEVAIKGTAELPVTAGTTHVQFGGRTTKGARLSAGTYALYATATDAAGTGAPVRTVFTVKRGR
ncbi:MAG: hypothetical protein JHD16_07205 [Solirubrobacteraceae bacterium]|nr:hypothetical protein [Solirubrobacteraceae bacterium]